MGYWCTISIPTDDPENINEDGDLRVYLRHLECHEECNQIAVVFYIRRLSCYLRTLLDELTLEISGYWHTVLLATDDPQKISDDGDLRVHLRHLECSEECNEIAFGFYIRLKKKCYKFIVVGKKTHDDIYESEYSGKNFFQIKYVSDGVIAFYNENMDKDGKVRHMTGLAAKESSLSEEEQKKFEELTVEMKIPKENIRNVTETDDCPAT